MQIKLCRQKEGTSCIYWCGVFFQVDRRKSNCVKEVERIEQRRKDRRKENAAIKEHQEEAYDTSDPNWQTSAMIKYVVYFCLEF